MNRAIAGASWSPAGAGPASLVRAAARTALPYHCAEEEGNETEGGEGKGKGQKAKGKGQKAKGEEEKVLLLPFASCLLPFALR